MKFQNNLLVLAILSSTVFLTGFASEDAAQGLFPPTGTRHWSDTFISSETGSIVQSRILRLDVRDNIAQSGRFEIVTASGARYVQDIEHAKTVGHLFDLKLHNLLPAKSFWVAVDSKEKVPANFADQVSDGKCESR